MPNRIIKESICTSDNINSLSPGAEILFYRLIVKADDFGCYHGNMKIVKSSCYPLKSDVIKDKQMISWMNELIKANLIFIYIADDGKQYLKLTKWEKHQQRRANTPKFPLPKSSDINGNQLQANVPENENVIENENRNSINEDAELSLSEFKNVKLTETERSKLYDRFGVSATDEAIEQFGGWMKGNGKTKKDHYATLINWIKRNQQPENKKKDVFDEARKILEAENGKK